MVPAQPNSSSVCGQSISAFLMDPRKPETSIRLRPRERFAGIADDSGVRHNVTNHHGTHADGCVSTDRDLVLDGGAGRHPRVCADLRPAANHRMSDDQRPIADYDIVRYVYQVVDACSSTDTRVTQGPPIDTRVAADFYIVIDHDAAEVRKTNPFTCR